MSAPYGAAGQSHSALPVETSVYAILSLISGILAWLGVFGLGGLLAIIFGTIARNEIRRSSGRISGDGLATAGLVLGYLNVALVLIGFCLLALLLAAGLASIPLCFLPGMNNWNPNFSTIP